MSDIMTIISRLRWQEAKTMKNIPHEYTVKNPRLSREYEYLYYYIKSHYYIEYFYGKPYKYCNIGEYKYWYMTENISESIIINRAKIGTDK